MTPPAEVRLTVLVLSLAFFFGVMLYALPKIIRAFRGRRTPPRPSLYI